MEFRELKRFAQRELATEIVGGYSELPERVIDGVPERLIQRWTRQWKTVSLIDEVPANPRLVNRFTLGADPEFSFKNGDGKFINAEELSLHAGAAFGMDMNGRLAEMRPAPSRFALDVVASLWVELRWMALAKPGITHYGWYAPPWDERDGIGGHVHFARKQSGDLQYRDVRGLDEMFRAMRLIGAFNENLCQQRSRSTKYGKYSDIRTQKHGYEYRSFPSYLETPWLTYLTLVLSKLMVYDVGLGINTMRRIQHYPHCAQNVLENFLSYYKNMDDDALIALHALRKHGLPTQRGFDFKQAWGILFPHNADAREVHWYPTMIEASKGDVQAMLDYLVKGEMLKPTKPAVTWTPSQFPKGYASVLQYSATRARIGIGEICGELVCHSSFPVCVQVMDAENVIRFQGPATHYTAFSKIFHANHQKLDNRGRKYQFLYKSAGRNQLYIDLPTSLRTNETFGLVKEFLATSGFPIWRADEVKEGLIEAWSKGIETLVKPQLKGQKLKGRILKEIF